MKSFSNLTFGTRLALLASGIFFLPVCAMAQTYHVRADASGNNNGSDWNNAYTALPATLQRAATYYIADGSYSGYTFDDAESGTTVTTIRKATVGEHGTDTGWQSGFARMATFHGDLNFATDNYVIDGAYRNENKWDEPNSYGFRIIGKVASWPLNFPPGGDNITIQYCDIGLPYSEDHPNVTKYLESGVYVVGNQHHITVQNCHIHNVGVHVYLYNVDNFLVERNYFGPGWQKESIRGQGVVRNGIIRHNIFRDASQKIPWDPTSGGTTADIGIWGGQNPDSYRNLEIYGNIIYNTKTTSHSNGVILVGGIGAAPAHNLLVYNNTFAGLSGQAAITIESGGSGNRAYNNLWYASGSSGISGGGVSSAGNNLMVASDPFVSYAAGDFRLKAGSQPINAGAAQAPQYSMDMDGQTRGADGVWDVGAFEYGGSVPPPPPSFVAQPADVSVSVGQTASFSVMAQGATPLTYQWQKNGVNVLGATGSTYTTPATSASDNGSNYSVVVSNSVESVTSASATLTVINTTPPTISLTSPVADASFAAPANITINATASDLDGNVSKVEFFNGATKLGEDGSSPYSFTWNNVSAGSHNVTAKATDNLGAQSISPVVSFTVDPEPFTISANPTTVSPGGTITVSWTAPTGQASASDWVALFGLGDANGNYGAYKYTAGELKGTTTLTVPSTPGAYEVRYLLNDGFEDVATSVAITVGNTAAPTTSISSPSSGASFVAPANITIDATASDSDGTVSKVEFFNGATLLGEDNSSPFSFNWFNVPAGSYSLTVIATDNSGSTARSIPVSISIGTVPPSAGTIPIYKSDAPPPTPSLSDLPLHSSVSKDGITWTFQSPVRVGQFINGDYYVVGPVTIIAIDPPVANGRNGSVLNLQPNATGSGFDSRILDGRYDASLRSDPPVSMMPGDILVSSISVNTPGEYDVLLNPGWPSTSPVRSVSILTSVSAPLPPDAFRPGYIKDNGGSQVTYYTRNLRRDILPKLAPVVATPALSEYEGYFRRPWIDNVFYGYDMPVEYMPEYGREIGRAVGNATLLLTLNLTAEQKEPLLVYLTQYGIDLHSAIRAGHRGWPAHGGHGTGRKLPILFAGLLLGDATMQSPSAQFGEDMQTIIATAPPLGPGWNGATALYAGHVGVTGESVKAGWGPYEHLQPKDWANTIGEDYRRTSTSVAWPGQALAAILIGAESLWNHPAFFAYAHRWMEEDDSLAVAEINRQRGVDYSSYRQGQTWDPFVDNMWASYYEKLPSSPSALRVLQN